MIIHKIIPSLDYNKKLKRLDTQLNEATNQNSISKSPMLLAKRISKLYYYFWACPIGMNSPLSPPSLEHIGHYILGIKPFFIFLVAKLLYN